MRWEGESLDEPDHLGDRRGVLSSRVRPNGATFPHMDDDIDWAQIGEGHVQGKADVVTAC